MGIVSLLLVLSSPFSIRSQQDVCPEVRPGRPVPFCRLDTGSMPLTSLIPPVYPPVLDQAGMSGTVRLEFLVDSSGKAGAADLRVLPGSSRAFEEPSRRAVLAHRFAVPRLAGKAVSAVVQLVVEFVNDTDSVPTRLVASHEVTVWGYTVRIGKEPLPRSLPPPALSPEDSIAALRVALLAATLPTSAEVERALCVSVRDTAPDPEALAELRARRPTAVPPEQCPPTYATWVITPGSQQRPLGALDPDFLRIGGLTAWTPDLVVVYITDGRGLEGTSYVCDVARVQEPSGWRVVRCRNHRKWVS